MEAIDVVIIDDDKSVLFFLGELLSILDISHKTAESGHQGLKIISQCRPRLTVLDVKLGSMTGLEVAREVINLSPDTRIVFMTGYSNSVPADLQAEVPVLAIMQKPFEVDQFLSLIQDALEEPGGEQQS